MGTRNSSEEVVNLIMPERRDADFYHRLSKQIVGNYVALSALEGAIPAAMPVLNDVTGTLSVPLSSSRSIDDLERILRSLPDAQGVTIERAPRFGASIEGE